MPDWAIAPALRQQLLSCSQSSPLHTGVFEKANQSPTMVVRRGAAPPPSVDDSSSSDEDDAFSAFGGKKKGKKKPTKAKKEHAKPNNQKDDDGEGNSAGAGAASGGGTNAEDTSSNRRHHHVSSSRQAKMDAMLKELQEAEQQQQSSGGTAAGHYGPAAGGHRSGRLPPPDKKGSYCEPGTEHLTTNIFVGNLDPCTTEEELTEAFRQFGDLYSVKIMWPRTAEERARGRNTGFVCFMDRSDAQEALDALSESDPFGTGRLLRLGWGKNVKMSVKRGTGGVPIPPIRGKSKNREVGLSANGAGDVSTGISPADGANPSAANKRQKTDDVPVEVAVESAPANTSDDTSNLPIKQSAIPPYDAAIHAADAIYVVPPDDAHRRKFITTVASFIAKDGSLLERKIAERESSNPKFSFLTNKRSILQTEEEYQQELVFYRWRVYAFTQNDGFDHWQTQPFVMFQPNGRFWIPPALDKHAAAKEVAEAKLKEADILSRKEERKKLNEQRQFMTGRQLEHAKFGGISSASEGAAKLNDWEMAKFDELFRKKLCQSRESICNAMAFCFEKSGASKQISDLLKEALLEDGQEISPETRIARLFLLSDVLFNSQQPGVRNAYRYRDSIEQMAPEIFESLGKHGKGSAGRMTMNKLNNAVSSVLNAWANWSVYNPVFLDELQARFDGKEMPSPNNDDSTNGSQLPLPETDVVMSDAAPGEAAENQEFASKTLRKGDWSEAQDVAGDTNLDDGAMIDEDVDGEALEDDDLDGEALSDDDLDGEALDDNDL